MGQWALRIIWFYSIWTTGAGCHNGLRFETSFSNASLLLAAEAKANGIQRFSAIDVDHCAMICYRTPNCQSALYIPQQADAVEWKKRDAKFSEQDNDHAHSKLRVMSFNTFLCGTMVDKGTSKVAKHIEMYSPDVVFLQEVHRDLIGNLMATLGSRWKACTRNVGPFNHIITRHRIVAEYEPSGGVWNNGCQIQLLPPDHEFLVNLWNIHLNPRRYGPYRACSRNKPIQSVDDLLNCETEPPVSGNSRIRELQLLSQHTPFLQVIGEAKVGRTPLIVAGDFNAPSHLDWTESAKPIHCHWSYEWPVSKLMESMGFIDSYRVLAKDPYEHPGSTWSTIYKDSTDEYWNGRPIPEPQDRIDFIYYISDRLSVLDSFVYSGQESVSLFPHYVYNDWPSDHASVVTTFSWESPNRL